MKKYHYFEVPTQVKFWDHPRGQWPEAEVDDNGILTACPAVISSTHRNEYGGCANYGAKCTDCCREFWLHEVE